MVLQVAIRTLPAFLLLSTFINPSLQYLCSGRHIALALLVPPLTRRVWRRLKFVCSKSCCQYKSPAALTLASHAQRSASFSLDAVCCRKTASARPRLCCLEHLPLSTTHPPFSCPSFSFTSLSVRFSLYRSFLQISVHVFVSPLLRLFFNNSPTPPGLVFAASDVCQQRFVPLPLLFVKFSPSDGCRDKKQQAIDFTRAF